MCHIFGSTIDGVAGIGLYFETVAIDGKLNENITGKPYSIKYFSEPCN